ncbi:alpha/beta hydrolase [Clostridium sp. CF011]|uniref:alpha/beta hydrolase n=1 Tax=unclassified Clostridium TaxID=2614128 RepID=UPI001C0AF923|nr:MULTISPECIES: alpha/beta hydrolase [unclassified Clostridium]MBU3092681.1 alpha/beta hydrolase [Clostridium sp. CF011]MBW9145633.1 alpha/beta hydrolase [Clostridium sp. CM027]UVE41513.1 alpha/beta hydrolase [Clostridium sp. CM027]WAG70513.1 alpha/beta hydrolase [Clostridium sp. CF011]
MINITFFILILIIITIFIIGWHFSSIIIYPRVAKYNYTYDYEVEQGKIDIEKFNNLEKQEVYLDSQYGYKIHGFFFPNNNSKKAIILCHGITSSLYGSVKYMDMFLKRGFAIFIYDHRNHGLSGGKNTSFGYYEKFDLKKCTDWLFNKLGNDIIVGLHGESMGAGIVLQNIAIDDRIKFCIDDCGYSDAQDLFKHILEKYYGIKRFPLIKLSSKISKIRVGWDFKDVSPITTLPNVKIPILFIHGEKDDYVPTFMCNQMYSVKKGYKDIYIAPGAGHAEAYWKNKDEYEKKVDGFLKAINII